MRPSLGWSHGIGDQGQNWAAGSDPQLISLVVHQTLISGMSSDCRYYCFFLDKKDRWIVVDLLGVFFPFFFFLLRSARISIVVKLYETFKVIWNLQKSPWWKLRFIFQHIFVFEVYINFKHIPNSNFSAQVEPHLFLFYILGIVKQFNENQRLGLFQM